MKHAGSTIAVVLVVASVTIAIVRVQHLAYESTAEPSTASVAVERGAVSAHGAAGASNPTLVHSGEPTPDVPVRRPADDERPFVAPAGSATGGAHGFASETELALEERPEDDVAAAAVDVALLDLDIAAADRRGDARAAEVLRAERPAFVARARSAADGDAGPAR